MSFQNLPVNFSLVSCTECLVILGASSTDLFWDGLLSPVLVLEQACSLTRDVRDSIVTKYDVLLQSWGDWDGTVCPD